MIVKFPSGDNIQSRVNKYLDFKSKNDVYNLKINERIVHINFAQSEIKFEDALVNAIGGDSDRQVR